MSKLLAQATEKLASHLEPGEQPVAAVKAHLEGGTKKVGVRFAATGVAYLESGPDGSVERELSHGAVLVATDRRLVVLSATPATFRPNEMVLSIPYTELPRIETGTKKLMLVKMPTIGLHDHEGNVLWFESPKIETKSAEAVVAAVRAGGVAGG